MNASLLARTCEPTAVPGRSRDPFVREADPSLYYTTDANMNVTALVDTSGTVLERVGNSGDTHLDCS